jgi:hypothetical protein
MPPIRRRGVGHHRQRGDLALALESMFCGGHRVPIENPGHLLGKRSSSARSTALDLVGTLGSLLAALHGSGTPAGPPIGTNYYRWVLPDTRESLLDYQEGLRRW